MANERLVVYYSCFNYEFQSLDFQHIESFLHQIQVQLPQNWHSLLQQEFQFLNIRISKYSLQYLSQLFLFILQTSDHITYQQFKNSLISDLSLASIWSPQSTQCAFLDSLLKQFFSIALQTPFQQFPIQFKLLSQSKKQPKLQALIVAEQQVTSFSQKFYRVLRRVKRPLQSLISSQRVQNISKQIQSLSSRVITSFQVTSQFATNILEIRQTPEVVVRVIQPAKEFYDQAIQEWLEGNFGNSRPDFAVRVKKRLGCMWNEKLVIPALEFCQIAQEEWEISGRDLDCFLHNVQDRLVRAWKESIVEASQGFQEHMVLSS